MAKRLREGTARTPRGELAYVAWGDAKSPKRVLCLHGWLDNAASFETLLPLLGEDRYYVAVDLIGHGLSAHLPPGAMYHFIDYIADTAAVAADLQWDRYTLLGHSLGGAVGAILAGTFPERIEKLALLESLGPVNEEPAEAPARLHKHVVEWEQLKNKKMPIYANADAAIDARVKAGGLTRESARYLVERGIKMIPGGVTWRSDPRHRLPSPLRMTSDQVIVFLANIACPTLVVSGSAGLTSHYPDPSKRTKALRFLEELKVEGGHHVHLDHPELIAATVDKFL